MNRARFQENFTHELKFEFHKMFACHKTSDFLLPFKNVKTLSSSRAKVTDGRLEFPKYPDLS